jgi:hypothetical protein
MSFGQTNAFAMFMETMNSMLHRLLDNFMAVFIHIIYIHKQKKGMNDI